MRRTGSLAVLLPMYVDRPRETRAGVVRVRYGCCLVAYRSSARCLVATTTCDTGVPARTVREPYLLLECPPGTKVGVNIRLKSRRIFAPTFESKCPPTPKGTACQMSEVSHRVLMGGGGCTST